jgi:hypothetical protein
MGWRRSWQAIAAVCFGGLGCARTLPLTDYDRCGLQGMELEGVRMTDNHGRDTHWVDGRVVAGRSSSRGREVSCKLPPRDDPERICEVKAYQTKAVFKTRHRYYSNEELEAAGKASVALWQRVYRNCMTRTENGAEDDL